MNKKAIAILGAIFLLIVGTLGFLIYSKYSTPETPEVVVNTPPVNNNPTEPVDPNTGNPVDPNINNPNIPTSAFNKLTDDQVVSPVLFFDGKGITYFDNQGNLYQSDLVDSNGKTTLTNKKKLDIPVKSSITKISWPPKGSDFIAEFLDPMGKKTFSYFNSVNQTYTDLPTQVTSFDWMPNGNQILYIWTENGKSTLNMGDSDTKNWKFLADMWENDNQIFLSPDGTQLLYYQIGNTTANNQINAVTSDGKVWKGLVKTGQNFGVLWSPDGQKFLFAKKDLSTQKYQLWVYNLTSEEVKNLGLFSTVEKALWDKDSNVIYVSVPNPNVLSGSSLTQDTFFRMDTTTSEKKEYLPGDLPVDGRNLFLSSTGDRLFFKNAQDGGLYYLDLTQ